ncbi:MAG: hypothetical protein JOZ10_01080 [Acidobacteria bacterium]|nr:hypothetical protein [Acidobacteriota bacterium]MBV9147159.1 hypothetical protein [Acidobacteriota bacterium]
MISPDQVDRLHDRQDLFTAILIVGCLFFGVGGVLGIFAAQDFSNGTNFMQRLAGAEQAVGLLLIMAGWIKLWGIHVELKRNAPQQTSSKAAGAGAGH